MKLPNGHLAIIDPVKLRAYCLSPTHPQGRHKAKVFSAALGLTNAHVTELGAALRKAAKDGEAQAGKSDEYGMRYVVDFEMTHAGKSATVRSSWIVLSGEDLPRLTSAYVLSKGL